MSYISKKKPLFENTELTTGLTPAPKIEKKVDTKTDIKTSTASPKIAPTSHVQNLNTSKSDEFSKELIRDINRDFGEKIFYDLSKDNSPITISKWLPTGSVGLDYCIANKAAGGLPEGRITEILGPTASGKSTLALVIAANVQKAGGVVIYIDSENALNIERAEKLGINLSSKFVYSPETCTETIFDIIEKTILKAKTIRNDIPIIAIWDSVAASCPKAEAEGTYEQNTIGLQARALRKGLRKINKLLANEKVTLVIINHITVKIGCVEPETLVEFEDA